MTAEEEKMVREPQQTEEVGSELASALQQKSIEFICKSANPGKIAGSRSSQV